MKNISEGTYMHCPHCEKKISFFSKALNSWGKFKICSHCQSDLEVCCAGRDPIYLLIHFNN